MYVCMYVCIYIYMYINIKTIVGKYFFKNKPKMGAIIKGNNKECEKPRCISVADKSSTKNFKIISKSGMVPAIAPYSMALLPIFFPNVASATDAPRTI